MPFCENCGTSRAATQEFCPKCRASGLPGVVTVANALRATEKTSGPESKSDAAKPVLTANIAGVLCYAFALVSGIVFLVLEPYRKISFVKFHAWQSIYFSVAWVTFTVTWSTLVLIFEAVTGGFLAALIIPIDCLLTLTGIGYWVWLMYRAYLGERRRIPLLGELAKRTADK
jgi:uncharacterized membrane protein